MFISGHFDRGSKDNELVEAVAVHTPKTAFIIGKNEVQEPIFAIGSKTWVEIEVIGCCLILGRSRLGVY